jgi:hypothetical protein
VETGTDCKGSCKCNFHTITTMMAGLYNSYQSPLAQTSKETCFTRQQKNVTCQINKDTNWYYTTPICSYSWIIINSPRHCYWNHKWATKTPDFQISWNLCISALEPEPSSLFWLHTSVDVASDMPASWSVDSTSLFLAKNIVFKVLFFAHHGHLQALKVCDLKHLCPSQLCTLKTG